MIAVVVMSTTTAIMLLLGPVTAHAASSGWSDGYARGTYDYANGMLSTTIVVLHIQTVIALTTV